MISLDKYAMNAADFEFKFTTSSGDKIDLKMFDSIEAQSSYKKGRGYTSEEFTLSHKYGYEFHYEGNGLDEKDLKEIKEAFKKVKPLLEKFLKEKESNEKVMNNVAHSLKSMLPTPKDENHLNAIKSEGVKTFDDVLKSIKADLEQLNKAKELFDKLFDDKNKLDIFG
ncbi:MAG: ATP/GTP-binding protein [Epsilonproteobacteria bacterium]|nr:ATP/GTP-binding protein [Campylobacterota bacterium]